ncbi:hypothetical protein MTR_7g011640 [Medicago truncatula]|uniref:RCD1 WWE domain-containing protein n=1 Tax=Medicago truncatula TaxID=3880 RepID=G7L332_MEDTR|nr:hypothetical protein MTR_7g011640 [Medicago truncatula]
MRFLGDVRKPDDSDPEDVVNLVKKDFKIKKAAIEVELDGQKVVLDFLHMYHVNYFFPKDFAGSAEEPNNIKEHECEESLDAKDPHEIKLHLSIEINGADESKLGEYSRGPKATQVISIGLGRTMERKRNSKHLKKTASEAKVLLKLKCI